jgi:hypothetical protein
MVSAFEPPFSIPVSFTQFWLDPCFHNRHIHFGRSLFRVLSIKNRKSTFPLSNSAIWLRKPNSILVQRRHSHIQI